MANAARLSQQLSSPSVWLGASAIATGAAYYSYRRYQSRGRFSSDKSHESRFLIASTLESHKGSLFGYGFTALTLEDSHMVNHNVKYLKFRLPEGYEESTLSPITSMLTNHTPEGAWIPVIRPYTPIDRDEPGHLSFLVKKYPNGKGSGHLHSLKPGDSLKMKPLHEFDYKPNQYSNVTILAGGAGITPFIQLIRSVMANPSDRTKINLVFANNTDADILLEEELDRFAAERPERFGVSYVVTNTGAGGVSKYQKGHITREIVERALPDRAEWAKSKVLVCGPDPMVEAVAGKKGFGFAQGSLGGVLKELGLEKGQVQKF